MAQVRFRCQVQPRVASMSFHPPTPPHPPHPIPGPEPEQELAHGPGPGVGAMSKNLPMKELAHEQELAHSLTCRGGLGWGGVGGWGVWGLIGASRG